MTAVRIFTPPNRLRAVLDDPTAPTVGELIAAAESKIAKLAPALRSEVERRRRELARVSDQPAEALQAARDGLRAAAIAICDIAPACGMVPAGEAARGVCEVIDTLVAKGSWRNDVLDAHVDALLWLTSDPSPTEREARPMLERLRGLRSYVGVPA